MKGEHLKYLGGGVIVLGLIASIPVAMNMGTLSAGIYLFIWSCLIGVFFIGFGELLYSVQRIELKIAGERPHYDPLTGQYVDKADRK
ncbi:hypothetical protein H70357_19290 [Paenibacillus sp. FSL H7-0357]|uniref:hypothetical protein n=1 Tax=unclassified Paenibacillus TaxID=185978 RepID=UPI0004F7B037|nr:hypothetical protein [Paenibacillus sp. FSL H7-0357]AIQ18606.1 hypothetical protein H70357_19290 [Paenibacillus sp. FSL H7-0357]